MLIINPLKPFYKDVKNKLIRMGNFKENAKEIVYEDDSLEKLFENLKEPISKEDLIMKMTMETGLTKNDVKEALEYLIGEKFIIDYEVYQQIVQSGRFNRQNLFFSMVSEKIKCWSLKKQPNILILGLGGIGSNVAMLLLRAGFSNFTLVDYDKVEESNLIRQFPYTEQDINKYKTMALNEKMHQKSNKINLINKKIEKINDIENEIINCDFVLCTLDKPSRVIRRLINNACIKQNKPVLFSGFSEHVAMVGPFVEPGKSACLKCIEKNESEKPLNNVKYIPSYGPLCLMISSIVANEIINYFYKFNKNNLIGKTLMFDILNYESNIVKWKRKTDCEVCGNDSK